MAYRDDLAAALMKVDELESQLVDAKKRISELEEPREPTTVRHPPEPAPLAKRDLAGGVHYDPPQTYFPLLHLLVAAAKGSWHSLPRVSAPDSDSLLLRVGYRALAWPFVYLIWRPVYVVCLLVAVLPWAALLAVALTIVLLPLIVVARLRVGDKRSEAGTGWPQREVTETAGAMALWVLMSFTMPMLLPVFLTLLKTDD